MRECGRVEDFVFFVKRCRYGTESIGDSSKHSHPVATTEVLCTYFPREA